MPQLARRAAPIVLFLLVPLAAGAQPLTEAQKDRLDPRLQRVVARTHPRLGLSTRAPAAAPVIDHAPGPGKDTQPHRYEVFIETGRFQELRAAGIRPNSTFRSFATARVTPAQLADLARTDAVEYVAVPHRAHPTNDVAAAATGIRLLHRGAVNNAVYKGQGTLTCIIDTGIDWSHLDFRHPADTTRSRIVSIWDQTLAPRSDERTPAERRGAGFAGLDYGVEYTRHAIEDEIDGIPRRLVRTRDIDGHGTHVAGTAAGNGSSLTPRRYVGMAPRSELVVVKAGDFAFSMYNVVNGMSYCSEVAAARRQPVVVNLSLGSEAGPHDGTEPDARAVDELVEDGRIVVAAAGNSANVDAHYSTTLPGGGGTDISFEVPSYTPQPGSTNDDVKIDIWFDGAPEIAASVWHDTTVVASRPSAGTTTTSTDAGSVYINSRVNTHNGDRHIQIQIYDDDAAQPPAAGPWKIRLINSSSTSTETHSWLYDRTLGKNAEAALSTGDNLYSINSPGTAANAITVGSYVHRWRWTTTDGSTRVYNAGTNRSDALSAFSSRGPRRDGVQKPDITAPGQGTPSSLSADAAVSPTRIVPGGKHFVTQGTSMAAPVVTGIAALLLQELGSLSPAQLTAALTSTARHDTHTGNLPNRRWGHGKVDAFKALAHIGSTPGMREILSYDEWGSELYLEMRSDRTYALRFTPNIDGQLPGAFIHTYRTVALSETLDVEVWSDDGAGMPNTQIGSTASVAPDQFSAFSWNYIDLRSTDVSLTKGASYHLVFSPRSPGDTLTVLADTETVDGRTTYSYGGAWSKSGADLRIRPEVAPFVSGANRAPVFAAELADTSIHVDETLSFTYRTTDADADPVGFRLAEAPGGAVVSTQGRLSWTPGSNDVGTHTVQVRADDGRTHSDSRTALVEVVETTERRERADIPTHFDLKPSYPNPFNASTTIPYTVPAASHVTVRVFDLLGREIHRLVDRPHTPGRYTTSFNASNLSSGVYFYRLEAGAYVRTRSMTLIK